MSSGRSVRAPSWIAAPPAGDAALDLCTAPRTRATPSILAVRLDEGVGDGMDEVGARRHVVLSCRKAAPRRLDGSPPNPTEAPSPARLDPGRLHVERTPHVAGRGTLRCRVVERERREPRKRCRDANTRRPKGRGRLSPVRWPGNDGRAGNGLTG